MKKFYNIFGVFALCLTLGACGSDDDFTESIFDTTKSAVDSNSTTAKFDQWLNDNFVAPYNTEIQYKFNFNASKLEYQLTPAEYEKSQLLAHFIKYLFYDVYTKSAGEEFLKLYGPRIIHFVGSYAYSPTTGTEELGYASGGVKITLINVNSLKLWSEVNPYTDKDVDLLNEKQFHTMHHEFSHILHQTKTYPIAFGQVTPGNYDARSWQERDSVEACRLGFVTQYASSATYEDFVETLSCTITDSDCRWMHRLIDMCLNKGMKEGDKDELKQLIQDLGIENPYDGNNSWNKFTIYKEYSKTSADVTKVETGRYVPSFHQADSKRHAANGVTLSYEKVKDITSFDEFLDWVELAPTSETQGINAYLKKLDIAKKWYKENWGLDMFVLRKEVRQRQNDLNNYIKNNVTIYDYQ